MLTHAPTLAIVGGGALGSALLGALVDRLLSKHTWARKPRIVLFEKSERVGRGLAYAKDASSSLLNTSAQTMSVVRGRRSHFFEWLAERGLAPVTDGPHFCSRQLFGDYVEDCFARSVDKARRRGILVSTIRDEVVTLAPRSSGGYRIVTRDHPPVDADVVVLAVGNLPSTRLRALQGPHFIASPYPGDALRARIPAHARVGILGTGLSAIDAALALIGGGGEHRGPVTMASRSGLLPRVRGPLHHHELAHVTRANVARVTEEGRKPLRWTTILRWLELELEEHGLTVSWERDFPAWVDPMTHLAVEVAAAEGGARLWQSIGEALNPMIDVLWHHLGDDDRRIFDRYRSRFMSHWVPVPLVTARRVLGLLREGKLEIECPLRDVTKNDSQDAYSLWVETRSGSGEPRSIEVDVVIDATGTARHLSEIESPLLDALLRQGTISAHDAGGVRVAFESLRVLDADGGSDPSLFALGNLTCGTHLFTSTLDLNVEKADRVAAHVTDELHRRIEFEKQRHVDATPHSS